MQGSGPQYPAVVNRLTKTAVDEAKRRRLPLVPQGQDALGELASRAALELQDRGLLADESSIARAEDSMRILVQALPGPGVEKRSAGVRDTRLGAAQVDAALMSLCPGLFPLC
jgi:hypothetical protein